MLPLNLQYTYTPKLEHVGVDELPYEYDEGDTDVEEYAEECIESSWHHRAMLHDEHRPLYRDLRWEREWLELEQKALLVDDASASPS